jgi:hypothetical protein
MWRLVDLVWTDVSEERIASIFQVEKSATKKQVWAGGSRLSVYWSTSSIQHHSPEDGILYLEMLRYWTMA